MCARRKSISLGLALAAAITAALAPGALAATRYAGPTGLAPEPCSVQANPCSLEDAVEGVTVMPGDVVVMLPGTYALGPSGLFIGENITVGGQAGQPRPLIISSDGVTIENSGSITTPPSLRDVDISHSGLSTALSNDGGLVERVVVTATAAGSTACGVTRRSGVDGIMRDSICRQTAGGAAVRTSQSGPGDERGLLRNVTAVSLAPGGTGISLSALSSIPLEIDAVNVIARGALTDVMATDDGMPGSISTVTLARSNYATQSEAGSSSTVTDPGTNGNQTAAPLFANAAAGDFHQLPGSPTIDAGVTDSLLGSLDFELQARVFGSAPDIGADEFHPVPQARKKCKKKKKKGKGKADAAKKKKKKRCKKKRGKRK